MLMREFKMCILSCMYFTLGRNNNSTGVRTDGIERRNGGKEELLWENRMQYTFVWGQTSRALIIFAIIIITIILKLL